jgi:hypothetical protein
MTISRSGITCAKCSDVSLSAIVPLLPTPNERDSFKKLACTGRITNDTPAACHA